MTLLANVLRTILHRVLLIARVKVSRSCSIIIFSKDYFRQQNRKMGEINLHDSRVPLLGRRSRRGVRPLSPTRGEKGAFIN